MKEIKLNGLDVCVFTDILENGLEVIFVPYKNKKNYFMSYATRFGSEITTFIPNDLKIEVKMPDGIAHFLEHKMFEQEDGVDPFTYFSESGTGANASTSFDNTQYICYGTKNFEDNLRFLLRYVNEPFYTDENVEKEKGIIAEELKMYADIPEWQIEDRLRSAVYKIHPRGIDIGGSIPEIMKITKEDLYTCYHNFYSPNNMFLLIVGNFNPDRAFSIVQEIVGGIENKKKPIIKKIKEPEEVNTKEDTMLSMVSVPKVGIGLKIATRKLPKYDDLILDLYLEMLTTLCFGSSSEFRERVRKQKLLNNLYMEWESLDEFKTFLMIASTDYPDQLIQEIKKELVTLPITEEAFSRMKKVWVANEVKMVDSIDNMIHNLFDDLIRYKKIIPNKVDIIRNLKLEELKKVINCVDFNNVSVVKMLPDNH